MAGLPASSWGQRLLIFTCTTLPYVVAHFHYTLFSAVIVLLVGQIPFVINFSRSLFAGKRAERNRWRANTLEWAAPTPLPHGNFESIPSVYHGPYVYNSPESADDWLPQDKPPSGRARTQPRIAEFQAFSARHKARVIKLVKFNLDQKDELHRV